MNFRQLTDNECMANREMLATESARSALERSVLSALDEHIEKYLCAGGLVKQLPPGAMTEHIPELNLACKKRRETASKGGEAAKVAKRQKA